MRKNRWIFGVFVVILCHIWQLGAVPKAFITSGKYVSTGILLLILGVFTVVSSVSAMAAVSNTYTVTFPSNPKSANTYQIGFGLHSLDIKFNMLRMQFDLQIVSTLTTGFTLTYSSLRGDLISLLRICYIAKQPTYTDLFYIQTHRNSNPFTIIYNFSPPKQFTYPITPSLPAGSLATIKQRTFLNAWDFSSTISTTDNNIDVYPSTSFPDESTVKVKFETRYDNVQVGFYSVTVVFWVDGQVASVGLGQYTVREVYASIFSGQNDANLVINTSPLQMLSFSTFLGIKAFHTRTLQTPNFLNFETTFTSTTQVKFPSLNRINWKYMKFQILIIEAKQCPTAHPYFMTNVQDCVASCPPGYVINVNLCVANVGLTLETMQKVPGTDRLEMVFKLDTNDPSFNGLYGQINWNSAVSVDIMLSGKQVTYIPSPYPQLKVVVDYTEDIWQKDKIVTIGGYDPVIYPNNFTDFTTKTFPLPKIDSKICPSTHPNWDITAKDCVSSCAVGYVSVNSKCTPNVDLQLQSISKVPDRNTVQMQFKLSPSHPSFTPLYSQINWNNAITLDIDATSKQVTYQPYPDPHLIVTVDYSSDLEQLDKTITISSYDSLLYPSNFVDFTSKSFQIPKVSSANGLAVNYYSQSTYRTSSYLAYFAIALIALYLTLFALGFIFGKVYILQMSIVPQVTYLCLTTLKTLSPTMTSLKLLKYIFGYSYSQQTQAGTLTLAQNRLSQWGISQYFIYNFNVMLALLVVTYLVLLGVYLKSKRNVESGSQTGKKDEVNWQRRKNFLLFQVPLYFVLWYGLWILFAGEVQMKYLGSDSLNKLMGFMGLALFLLCFIVFSLYFGLYSRKHSQFKAFYDALGQPSTDSRMKYFYLSYFIQKLLLGSLMANLYTQKFPLYITIGLNLAMTLLIAIARPSNISNSPKEQKSCLRSSIRPMVNYLITIIILALFLVTNQIQVKEGSFAVNVPVIVLCLMLGHVVMTVGFLVVDGVLKRDWKDFREMVMGKQGKYGVEEGEESQRRVEGVKEIMGQQGMQGKQGKQGDMSNNNKQRSISQSINAKSHPSHNTPTHITPQPQQPTYNPLKQPLQQQQHLTVQQMLTLMAQNNQSQYQKQHSPLNHLTQRQQRTSSKRLHKQIMSTQPGNNVKLLNMISEWKELEDVDSKRMDKLMQVDSRGEQRQGDRKGDESKVMEGNIRKSYQSKAKVFQEYFSRNTK